MRKRYLVVVDPHNQRGQRMEETMADSPLEAAINYIGKDRVKRTLFSDTTLEWTVYEIPEDWHRSEFIDDEEAKMMLEE